MNAKEPNSAVEVILFVGNREGRSADLDTPVSAPLSTSATSDDNKSSSKHNNKIANESILELLVHLISEPAFDQLRTKEQLGYIVHTSSKKIGPLCGLQMIVQSSHKDPAYLDTRIELFLELFRATLGAFTEEELKTDSQAVIEKLLEKPKNLDQESMRHWEEIKNAFYLFDRNERLAKHLRNVKLSDCTEFFDLFIAAQSGERRKVSSQLYGKGTKYPKAEAGTNKVIIKNPIEFKRAMSLEPMCTFSAN
jgi:secreted Zn-dependent insulinase-like peptidase